MGFQMLQKQSVQVGGHIDLSEQVHLEKANRISRCLQLKKKKAIY